MTKFIFLCTLLLSIYTQNGLSATIVGNDWCSGKLGNFLYLTLEGEVKPFYSAQVNDVLATFSYSASLTCPKWNQPPTEVPNYVLQIIMNSTPVPGYNDICETGIDGIGFQAIDTAKGGSKPIGCKSWGQAVHISPPLSSPNIDTDIISGGVKLIKVKDSTSLAMGFYPINFINNLSINSFWDGGTSPSAWGKVAFKSGIPTIEFKTCSNLAQTPTVNFGPISIPDIGTAKSAQQFSIMMKDCGSENSAIFFNKYSTMRFTSNNISPTGQLLLDTCESCAKNVNISIKNTNGTIINLNDIYNFSKGTSTTTPDSASQNFVAELIATGPVHAGLIHSTLSFEITTP